MTSPPASCLPASASCRFSFWAAEAICWFQTRALPDWFFASLSSGTTREEDGDRTIFSVAAGEEWDAFVARAVGEGYAGIECLSGIPGTVGGTPVQNVGAYGQEVSHTITAVRALDRQSSQFVTLTNAECGFAYRSSIFNTTDRERYIVSRVDYSLERQGTPEAHLRGAASPFRRPRANPCRGARRRTIDSGAQGDADSPQRSRLAERRQFFQEPHRFFDGARAYRQCPSISSNRASRVIERAKTR